jgi:hypothetical protein
MKLDELFSKLQNKEIGAIDYNSLRSQCIRLVKKACGRYKIHDILFNKSIKEDVYADIYITSILKTLDGYKKEKGAFSTYFFYKACSSARNEVGKLKRRIKLNNSYSFDDTRGITNPNTSKYQGDQDD